MITDEFKGLFDERQFEAEESGEEAGTQEKPLDLEPPAATAKNKERGKGLSLLSFIRDFFCENIGLIKENCTQFYREKGKNFTIASICLILSLMDCILALFRILMFFYTINRLWMWTNFIYMAISIALPFVGWIYSTDTDFFYYKSRKRMYFMYAFIHIYIVLVQPLMAFTAGTFFPYLQGIKITEVFSKEMVIWFARYISLFLPLAFFLLVAPLTMDTVFTTLCMRELLLFKLSNHVDDRGENKEYCYDLQICKDLETGGEVIEYEKDRMLHKLITGPSGCGKTGSVILPSINNDLRIKAQNDDLRYGEFERMIKEGKAFLNFGDDYIPGEFKDKYVVPLDAYKKEYVKICNKYRTCCIILMAPDDQTCIKAMELCRVWGVKPKLMDPSAFNDDTKTKYLQYLYGINPLYVPMDLDVEGECVYIPRVAEDLEYMITQAKVCEGKPDPFFTEVNEHITSMITAVTILYYRRVKNRQATFDDFTRHLLNPKTLIPIMSDLEDLYGRCSQNRLREDDVFKPEKRSVKTKDGESNVVFIEKECDPEYKRIAFMDHPEVGKLGYRLSETSFENVFNQIYTELLNPGEKGSKTNKIAENINEWAYGLRNIASKLLQRPELKKILTMKRVVDFDQVLENGDVVICNFCMHLGPELSTGFGLMVQFAINNAMLRRLYNAEIKPCPVFEFMDEMPRLIGPWYETTNALWRKFSGSFTGAIQSDTQFAKNETTKYLKGIAQGSGNLLIFGRISADEMELYNKLAGKKKMQVEMETTNETSILSDSPTYSYGKRVQDMDEDIMSGTDIRERQFLEATNFAIQKGDVKEARNVKTHFLPEDISKIDKIGRRTVDFDWLAKEYPMTSSEEAYLRELEYNQIELAKEARRLQVELFKNSLEEVSVSGHAVGAAGPTVNVNGLDIVTQKPEEGGTAAPQLQTPGDKRDAKSDAAYVDVFEEMERNIGSGV